MTISERAEKLWQVYTDLKDTMRLMCVWQTRLFYARVGVGEYGHIECNFMLDELLKEYIDLEYTIDQLKKVRRYG